MRARCTMAALLLALLTGAATAQSDLQFFTACPAPLGVSGADVQCRPAPLQLRVGQTPTFATQRGDTYNASVHYALVVQPPPGHQVIATITAFATEQGYDLFSALDATANLTLLPPGSATGLSGVNTLPLPYTIRGNFGSRLALALTSDSSTESTGVRLTLSVVAPCPGAAPLALPGTQECYGASACPAGTYASLATGSCEYCPAGTASAAVGAASAAACRPCKQLAQAVQAGSATCPVLFTSCPAPGVCPGLPLVLIPTFRPTLAVTQASASYSPAASYFLTVSPPPGYFVRVRLVAFDTAPTDFLVATTGTAGPFTLAGLAVAEPIFKDSGAPLDESAAGLTFDGYVNSTITLQLLAESHISGGGSGVTLELSALRPPCAPPSFLVAVRSEMWCASSCPEGTYVSGASTCGICPQGTYASAPTSDTPSSAAAACKLCPNGTTSAPGVAYGTPASGACLAVLGAAGAGLLQPPALTLPVPLPPLLFSTPVGSFYDVGYALTLLPPPGYYLSITTEFVRQAFAVLAGNVSAYPALPVPSSSQTQWTGPYGAPLTLLLSPSSNFEQGQGVQGRIELVSQLLLCSDIAPLSVIDTLTCVSACPLGAWQSSPSACTQCPANYFGTEQGASSAVCRQCPPGFSSPPGANAASDCTPCPLQHFRASGGAACSACPAGSIAASTGAQACVECSPGEGNTTDDGVPTCAPCALGSYRNAGMAVCTACPPGSIGDSSASPAACALCPSGTYSANALQCLPCAPGMHAPVPGSAQCVPCSAAACGAAYQVATRTLAGGRSGFRNGRAARFNSPLDVEVDGGSGTVFVADTGNNCLRSVTAAGVVGIFAGVCGPTGGFSDSAGSATFRAPAGISWSAATSTLYVCDSLNHRIRRVVGSAAASPAGAPPSATLVATLAGSGARGKVDGIGLAATFNTPIGCAVAAPAPPTGNGRVDRGPQLPVLFVADTKSHAIRRVSPVGLVTTLVGGSCSTGTGDKDGIGAAVCLNSPTGLAPSPDGTRLYFADSFNRKLKAVVLASGRIGNCYTLATMASGGELGLACSAQRPGGCFDGVAVDAFGSVLFVDSLAESVYALPGGGGAGGSAKRVLGLGRPPSNSSEVSLDGASGEFARLLAPRGLAQDGSGRIFLADGSGLNMSNTLKVLEAETYVDTALAGGSGVSGKYDGSGADATFNSPDGMAAGEEGNLFVADADNGLIRVVTPYGEVKTVAGDGPALKGDAEDGSGTSATFTHPLGVAYSAGYLAVSDVHAVRWLTLSDPEESALATSVRTIAGRLSGTSGSSDNQVGKLAFLNAPRGLAIYDGCLYVADSGNSAVRMVILNGTYPVSTLAQWPTALGPSVLAAVADVLYAGTAGALYSAKLGGGGQPRLDFTLVAGSPGAPPGAPSADGTGSAARFSSLTAVAYDLRSALWLADGQRLRALDVSSGQLRTLLDLSEDVRVGALAATPSGLHYIDVTDGGAVRSLLTMACPPGSYCPSRTLALLCPAGRYGAAAGLSSSACTGACPGGAFCPAGSLAPLGCPPGSFCPPGASAPTPCAPGSASALPNATQCVLCSPGLLAPAPGSLVCADYCPPGRANFNFGGVTVNASCSLCPPGTYAGALGSTLCSDCPAGRFTSANGTRSLSACAPCPAGLVAPAPGAAACVPCADASHVSTDGLTCAAYVCPRGTQSAGRGAPRRESDCVALACPPPLAPPLGGASSFCAGCPAGRAGAPGACRPCPSGALCPGGTSHALHNFSAYGGAAGGGGGGGGGGNGSRALQAAAPAPPQPALACPALAPAAAADAAAPRTWASFFFASVQTLVIVLGSLLGAVLLLYAAARAFPQAWSAQLARALKLIDFFFLKRAVQDGAQPVARYSAVGGLWTLVALAVYLGYSVYLILQWTQGNTVSARTLDVVGPETWGAVGGMPATSVAALGGGGGGAGLLLRLTLDGEAGACGELLAPGLAASGLASGSWAQVGNVSSCGSGSSLAQLTFACAACDFTLTSALTLPLHHSCQSMLLEVAAAPASGAALFQRAQAAATATQRLGAVTWTVVPILDVRVDNTTATTARGYRLLSTPPSLALAAPPALGDGTLVIAPLAAGVLLTINTPLSATYMVTTVSVLTPWYTLVANLLGLSSIIGGIGMIFLILEEQKGSLDALGKKVLGVELGSLLVGGVPAALTVRTEEEPAPGAAGAAGTGAAPAPAAASAAPAAAPPAAAAAISVSAHSSSEIYGDIYSERSMSH